MSADLHVSGRVLRVAAGVVEEVDSELSPRVITVARDTTRAALEVRNWSAGAALAAVAHEWSGALHALHRRMTAHAEALRITGSSSEATDADIAEAFRRIRLHG
ncbi:hypothetical protein PJ985_13325 [Streptomyces sp. ACA25]|uniref:hypothetical protein n=1 Tax=Streptomyces sp. ACA25 TaxID=3022596 RepID=UPI002306ECAB|nr:hypothetical protein [Streptomyces sp. ACA25]MDB1088549.1 hypothetical protein [Streptomyces sp. ACA25]